MKKKLIKEALVALHILQPSANEVELQSMPTEKPKIIEISYEEIANLCNAIAHKELLCCPKDQNVKYKKIFNARKLTKAKSRTTIKKEVYYKISFEEFCGVTKAIIEALNSFKNHANINTTDLGNRDCEKIIGDFNDLITNNDLNFSNESIKDEMRNFEEALRQHKVHCESLMKIPDLFDEKNLRLIRSLMDPNLLKTFNYLSNEIKNYEFLQSKIETMAHLKKIDRDGALNDMLNIIKNNRSDFFRSIETIDFLSFQKMIQKPLTVHEFLQCNAH